MTYPGLQGQIGPAPTSTTGWQVRQSRAGGPPGKAWPWPTVIDSMGGNAPAWGITAEANTMLEEVADNPHPIEAEDFELNFDQPVDGSAADYTGLGGS